MIENRKVPTYPVMELPWMAFLLAIAAGGMDGYSYFIGKAFATVQSGNVILVGQTLATKNWDHFWVILATIFSFGVGSAITAILEFFKMKNKKVWTFEILILEVIILIVFSFSTVNQLFNSTHLCMIVSFVAGLQGNAFHKIDGMLYGNVAVTLNVQLAFNYFIQGITGVKGGWKNCFEFFVVLLGFSIGGFVGTRLSIDYGEKSLWFSAVLLICIAIYTKVIKIEDKVIVIDPT